MKLFEEPEKVEPLPNRLHHRKTDCGPQVRRPGRHIR